MRDVTSLTDTAMLPENKSLNRVLSVLPDDKYRVYLNSRDNQAYVNAVRVNVSSTLMSKIQNIAF